MKLRFTPRALAEAKRIKSWWRQYRPAASASFEEELEAALARIRGTPNLGTSYRPGHFDVSVRRVLLPRTRHHVYYAVEHDAIVVLSVWGALQGRDPAL